MCEVLEICKRADGDGFGPGEHLSLNPPISRNRHRRALAGSVSLQEKWCANVARFMLDCVENGARVREAPVVSER